MKYYIDCEFDGLDGPLLSMGIVSETGRSLYAVMDYRNQRDPWVRENVIPILMDLPLERVDVCGLGVTPHKLASMLEMYFKSDAWPHVVADWPDDLKYLAQALITGPGTMIDIPGIMMSINRVDAYPTRLKGAVQHNAWWDAMALRECLTAQDDTQLDLYAGAK